MQQAVSATTIFQVSQPQSHSLRRSSPFLLDPAVIEADGKWYAFATRSIGSAVHVQVAESDDFAQWNLVTNEHGQYDALPNLPSWIYAKGSAVWAPDVVQLDDGSYVM